MNKEASMRKKRFNEYQIIKVLKQAEEGRSVTDVCRQHGISTSTFYNWRDKYGGMSASEVRRLKELEKENRRLKQLYAEASLEIAALKDIIEKKL
jgi:putative transposase